MKTFPQIFLTSCFGERCQISHFVAKYTAIMCNVTIDIKF